jgi:ribosomal protein S18 acetylase RimI-like enzyme
MGAAAAVPAGRPLRVFVAETLASAFADDPAFAALFPRDTARALTDWFDAVADVLTGCDLAHVGTHGPAVGVWTTGYCQDCVAGLDDRLFEVLNRHAGPAGVELAAALAEAVDAPEPDDWFLHWIGTPHGERRAGHGRRLLTRLLRESAEAAAPLWTTTTNPGAVSLYTGLGMSVRAERAAVGRSDLTCWTMCSAPARSLAGT